MWWSGLDADIAKSCQACLSVKHAPAVAPLQPWTWPSKPWERIHVDFAGPFQGTMLFVLVDASSTTTSKTIDITADILSLLTTGAAR